MSSEELLLKLMDKIEKLQEQIDELKRENNELRDDSKPGYHSIEENIEKVMKDMKERRRKRIEPKLEKAVDMAILHYQKDPPARGPRSE